MNPSSATLPYILVAEDNEAALQGMVEALLRTKEYNVLPCDNGFSAHKLIVDHKFDLLITDNRLPGYYGIDIITDLRKRQIDVRCLIVTNWPDAALTREAMKNGVSRVLPKPIHYPTFIDIVARTLRDPAPPLSPQPPPSHGD